MKDNINGFKLERKLAESNSCTVYKAIQLSLGRPVALKVLKREMCQYPEQVARFKLQSKATENIRHENIIQTFATGESNGSFYTARELVNTRSLAQHLRRNRPLPFALCLRTVESAVQALETAWDGERILHANLKPENILIEADGTIKLTDFSGITEQNSKALLDALATAGMSSPRYSSPEMMTGHMDISFRSDIYSLGAILYNMLTGYPPFQNMTYNEIQAANMRMQTVNPVNIDRNISTAATTLAQKMMIKELDGRYQDWEELKSDIASVAMRQIPLRGNLNQYESAIADYEPQARFSGKSKPIGTRIKFALIYAAIVGFLILNVYLFLQLNNFIGLWQ